MLARPLLLTILCLATTLACRMNPPPDVDAMPRREPTWIVIFACDAGPDGDGPTLAEIGESTLPSIGSIEVESALSFVPGPCFGPDPHFAPPERPSLFFVRIDGEVDGAELRERLEREPLIAEGRVNFLLGRTPGS